MNKDDTKDFVETRIQAILFADSFQTKFLPVSQDVPKVLMPIANTPMIDYTIKFLRDNRIKDIIIYTSNNRSKIEEYFKRLPPNFKKTSNIKIFSTEERSSVGQALRDIHSKEVIQAEDILLVFGDVIANFDLTKVISEYTKKKKDRSIMTKIFKRVPPSNPLRNQEDDCVVIVDNVTSQILDYRHIGGDKDIQLNLEKINFHKSRNNIEMHYDWVDTDITLCTKEIFHLLNEHFYNDFRDDLVLDVLNSEISEDRIFAYLLDDSDFTAKVTDFRTYGIINQYITARWLYPIVPTTHDLRLKEKSNLRYSDFNLYLGEGVDLAYSAKVSNSSIIGKDTNIDEGSVVDHSIIGRSCKIGKNVKITESIIWNNVVINDDCVLDRCLIADGVVIGAGSKINSGAVLALNVEVNKQSEIPINTLISLKEGTESSLLVKGKIYENKDFELTSEEYIGAKHEYFAQVCEYPEGSEGEEEEDDEAGFKEDVTNLIEVSIKDKVSVDNVAIELESSRLRSNATFSDCINYAVPIILEQIDVGDGSANSMVANMTKTIEHWKKLFKAIVKSERDEGTLLAEIEGFCIEKEAWRSAFHLFLQLLYTKEIISSGIILEWAKEAESSDDEIVQTFLKKCDPFLQYLRSEDEEEEDEEDEDEEEEGEDDN